ncbi:MAG: RNA polymerase sigma factor [Gammaproteobacteria bacterium]|nr:RNA polymerase sigma factor [Gammaproteobacteria bacterium]
MNDSPSIELDFDVIAREQSPALLRYLRRRVGDHADAADLLQETLIKASRGLGSFAGRASLQTWLLAIARNVANDFLRRPERRHSFVAVEEAIEVEDGALGVEQRMEADETNLCVREVIDSLTPDYRAALILHDLEGLDCEQTAEVVGGSVGAVKVRLHRARLRLKSVLERRCGFYRDSDSVLRCERRDVSSIPAGGAADRSPTPPRALGVFL